MRLNWVGYPEEIIKTGIGGTQETKRKCQAGMWDRMWPEAVPAWKPAPVGNSSLFLTHSCAFLHSCVSRMGSLEVARKKQTRDTETH